MVSFIIHGQTRISETLDNDMAIYTLIISVCILCVSYLLYRRSSKLPPGPPGLPFLGNLPALFVSKRDMHDVFTSWSKQYGPVFSVRLGSLTAVVLNDFQSMKKALAHPNLQDRPFLDYMLAVPGEGNVMTYLTVL